MSLTDPMSVSDALVAYRDALEVFREKPAPARNLLAMEQARRAARHGRDEQEVTAVTTYLVADAFEDVRVAGLGEAEAMFAAMERDEQLCAERREDTQPKIQAGFYRPRHMTQRRAE